MLQRFVFHSMTFFFNFRVLVKFVKYSFKVCDNNLLFFIMLRLLWRMIVLLLFKKRCSTFVKNFLVPVIHMEFKLLKYYFLVCFRTFTYYYVSWEFWGFILERGHDFISIAVKKFETFAFIGSKCT